MNSTYCQNAVNRLEKDIADLQKKIADESKKEVDKTRQMDSISRSVNNTISISSLQYKQRQIKGYQKDISDIRVKIANFQKLMASKSSDLGRAH